MLRKQPRHQVPWTSMALLLLSCPNPRNCSISSLQFLSLNRSIDSSRGKPDILRRQPCHRVPWTSMGLLLLSCLNPRDCFIIIPRTTASASKSNARPLRRCLIGTNDYLECGRHHHPRRRRRPEDERALQKESVSSNLQWTERLPHRGPKFSHEKHSLRDATESDEKLFFELKINYSCTF